MVQPVLLTIYCNLVTLSYMQTLSIWRHGLSDQASFEMAGMHHAENLSQLVRKLNLREITLGRAPLGRGRLVLARCLMSPSTSGSW